MGQSFTIGQVQLIEDDEGYGVAQRNKDGDFEVIASFKFPLDALTYFTEFSLELAQLTGSDKITWMVTRNTSCIIFFTPIRCAMNGSYSCFA